MKRRKVISEAQLRNIVGKAVKRVLSESKGKNKLQNSFKSKEDATYWRDLYSPDTNHTIVDTDNTIYHDDYSDRIAGDDYPENGPYMPYSHHSFADGYDYCGDDLDNEYAQEYNNSLKKRLATKGGQMSYDWDTYNDEKNRHLASLKGTGDRVLAYSRAHDDDEQKRLDRWGRGARRMYTRGYDEDLDEYNDIRAVDYNKSVSPYKRVRRDDYYKRKFDTEW